MTAPPARTVKGKAACCPTTRPSRRQTQIVDSPRDFRMIGEPPVEVPIIGLVRLIAVMAAHEAPQVIPVLGRYLEIPADRRLVAVAGPAPGAGR